MLMPVARLRGMDLITRRKLKRRGITNTHQLLAAAGGFESRRRLARAASIDEEVLTHLVKRADLARIKGIGATYADLLNRLGVDRLSELARYDPTELQQSLSVLNTAEGFARRAPTAAEVRDWIIQARTLPLVVDR